MGGEDGIGGDLTLVEEGEGLEVTIDDLGEILGHRRGLAGDMLVYLHALFPHLLDRTGGRKTSEEGGGCKKVRGG